MRGVAMPTRVPHLYLDTTVLVDLYYDRRQATTELIVLGRQFRWQLASSHFALMELIDVLQESMWARRKLVEDNEQLNTVIAGRHARDLTAQDLTGFRQKTKRFLARYDPAITFYDVAGEGFLNRAMGLCLDSNMSAPDCLHVQMAIEIGVDLLITSDSQVQRYGEDWVRVSSPERTLERLRDLEFELPGAPSTEA
jgi:predicted nucleic acid-binding protein